MIRVENIHKSFKEKKVLNGINLELHSGEIYGLIGKNGAGKTTLMNIMAMVLKPDKGKVFVDGKEIKNLNDLSGKIGYVLDIPSTFDFLTPIEYLEFLLSPKGLSKDEIIKKSKEILRKINLTDSSDKLIRTFSRGMKQRMGIASGIISDPKIIIMDEPSSSLDPEGRFDILQIIKSLGKEGRIILLSTHILDDIERICDRIGLLVGGKIAIEGKTNEIIKQFSTNTILVNCEENEKDIITNKLKSKEYVEMVRKNPNGLEIEFKEGFSQKVFKDVVSASKKIFSIGLKRASIEEIFIRINKEAEFLK